VVPGVSRSGPREGWVLADFARRNADRLSWLAISDVLLAESRVLNGRDVDLAADAEGVRFSV